MNWFGSSLAVPVLVNPVFPASSIGGQLPFALLLAFAASDWVDSDLCASLPILACTWGWISKRLKKFGYGGERVPVSL